MSRLRHFSIPVISTVAMTGAAILGTGVSPSGSQELTTLEYTCTGEPETLVIPEGVSAIGVEAFGAEGGSGYNEGTNDDPQGPYTPGGLGGTASGGFAVEPGDVITIYVGCEGGTVPAQDTGGAPGGFGGSPGGPGGNGGDAGSGGGGGGSSDVRIGGTGLDARVLVAGGGGGSGGIGRVGDQSVGGNGGGEVGEDGGSGMLDDGIGGGGQGGQAAGGGTGGSFGGSGDGSDGTAASGGAGGNGDTYGAGGGGGGGWFGGGGGAGGTNGGGGGGGSSYVAPSATGASTSFGVRSGDGLVRITFQVETQPTPTPTPTPPAAQPTTAAPTYTG